MMLKRINFQSIPVTDQQRALEFYRDRLGMTVQTDAPYEEEWRWIFMQIPGAETLLHFARPDELSASEKIPMLCLVTDDVDTETAALKAAGTTIIDGPANAPWEQAVRYTLFKDSESNTVLLQSSSEEGA